VSETRVDITIRVVPMDTSKPTTEATTALLFDDTRSDAQRRDSVANAAGALYPKAARVRIPTPEREGGRG
jgi:hypothetical protein